MPEGVPASSTSVGTGGGAVGQNHTAVALRELYQQVSSMPESAKKKKLIRQVSHTHSGHSLTEEHRVGQVNTPFYLLLSDDSFYDFKENSEIYSINNLKIDTIFPGRSNFIF